MNDARVELSTILDKFIAVDDEEDKETSPLSACYNWMDGLLGVLEPTSKVHILDETVVALEKGSREVDYVNH